MDASTIPYPPGFEFPVVPAGNPNESIVMDSPQQRSSSAIDPPPGDQESLILDAQESNQYSAATSSGVSVSVDMDPVPESPGPIMDAPDSPLQAAPSMDDLVPPSMDDLVPPSMDDLVPITDEPHSPNLTSQLQSDLRQGKNPSHLISYRQVKLAWKVLSCEGASLSRQVKLAWKVLSCEGASLSYEVSSSSQEEGGRQRKRKKNLYEIFD